MKMVGERPLNALMDGLADVRKAKVKEAFEKAVVKCTSAKAAPPRSAAPPKTNTKKAPNAAKPTPVEEDEVPQPKKPVAKPPAKPVVCLSYTVSFVIVA